MPQADAEGGDAVAHELAQVRNHGGVIRRVAGAVGQHQAVGIQVQDFLRRRARRNDRDRTAALFEFALDVRLCAEVPEDDVVDTRLLRGLNAVARHVLNRRMERQHLQLRADFLRILRLLGQQRGIHHARIADNAGQRAGVHPSQAGNALRFEVIIELALAAEVARLIAEFTDDIRGQARARRLEVLRNPDSLSSPW